MKGLFFVLALIFCMPITAAWGQTQPQAYFSSFLNFGTTRYGDDFADLTEPIELYNIGADGLEVLDARFEGGDAREFRLSANNLTGPIEQNGVRYIYIEFHPQRRRGLHSTTLRVETNDPATPVAFIPVSGAIEFVPNHSLDLEKVRVNRVGDQVSIEGDIVVKNIGAAGATHGRKLSVALYDQNSCAPDVVACLLFRRTLFKAAIPRLNRRQSIRIHFESKPFSAAAHFFDRQDEIYATLGGADIATQDDHDSFYFSDDAPANRYKDDGGE